MKRLKIRRSTVRTLTIAVFVIIIRRDLFIECRVACSIQMVFSRFEISSFFFAISVQLVRVNVNAPDFESPQKTKKG